MARMTDRFLTEIRRSHRIYAYVDVIGPNQETMRLPVVDGEVSCDRTAEVRRTCRVKCIDPLGDLTPKGTSSLLTPYGTELRPYRGVQYDDGTIEVAPLGVFRLSKVNVDDTVGGSPDISLEAYDRSRTIARHKFKVPYLVPEGTNVVDAIKDIIERTFPGVDYDSISTTVTTPAPMVWDAGDSPWKAVTDLGTSIGCDVFFDVNGWVVIAPPTDPDALPAPAFTYIEGPGCTMTDLSLSYTDEPGYNGVIVIGESPGDELPPVRAEAWDMEPTSPTYRFGPYGEVPMFHSDDLVKTQEEALAVANGLLANLIGFSSLLSVTAWANPALEAGEVIQVERERSHVSGLYALDAFNVPLSKSGTQNLTVRAKRVL